MLTRRNFIRNTSLFAFGMGTGFLPLDLFSKEQTKYLTILHTNDVHSRIDPFDNGKFKGMGGVVNRHQLISQIRKETEHVLLLDAGDIFQGTPYFNMYGGEVEMKAMTLMGYDAATLGNHDFDAGEYGLLKQLPHAKFDFINSNYDFKNSLLEGNIQAYKIINKGKIKIGIIGAGIALEGLVPKKLFGDIIYNEPIDILNELARKLKQEQHCNLIICLSHLGYSYSTKKVSDLVLAKNSKYIDIILGGHTHTFLEKPTVVKNLLNEEIIVNQVGWGGIKLGRIDIIFSDIRNRIGHNSSLVNISEKTIVN